MVKVAAARIPVGLAPGLSILLAIRLATVSANVFSFVAAKGWVTPLRLMGFVSFSEKD